MKKIAVLTDLKESGKPALQQAEVLARASGAEVVVVHVTSDSDSSGVGEGQVERFSRPFFGEKTRMSVILGSGNFLHELPGMMDHIQPDLVVFCTHGIHGLSQNLFGAHALKLVQSIHYPCLVVQENSRIKTSGMLHFLLPASPFPNFEEKIKQCASLATLFGADVTFYEIDKYLGNTEEPIALNKAMANEYFSGKGIPFTGVLEENKVMSLGHAQQTLNYAKEHGMDLICLSSQTHQETMAMGKADKENFLTNESGIPVLCCG